MRVPVVIALLFLYVTADGQKHEGEVLRQIRSFHQAVAGNDVAVLKTYVHDSLSYGHSNGWIEKREEFLNNIGAKMVYHSFKEDSMQVVVDGRTAYSRFIADIDVSMDGKRGQYHLKVLEIWTRSKAGWKIIARQAVR